MALLCRALVGALAAVVVARSSATITWNTHPAPAPASTPVRATVIAVRGTLVQLRLGDGTTRSYVATPEEAKTLRALTGYSINFIVK